MADGAGVSFASLKGQVSDAEWTARVELAALYRLVALNGWDDLIFTHISARLPGPEHHFLINPYGLSFDEVTASSLVRIDLHGKILQQTDYVVNAPGFAIHSAVHGARDDAMFVLHLHTDEGIAVAAQREGLLPITQTALGVRPLLAYHDYEGIAELDERERLVADLGDKILMILRNHGLSSLGATAADCWAAMYFLQRACAQQVMALSAGRENVIPLSQAVQDVVHAQVQASGIRGDLAWPACLRRLAKDSPGYDT